MTFTISPLTIDRYEDVITLWKETEGIGLSDADSKKNIQFYLERNPNMSFVVKDKEGTILGAVLCGTMGEEDISITLLYVKVFNAKAWVESSFKNVYLVCKLLVFRNVTFSSFMTIKMELTFGRASAGPIEMTSRSSPKTYNVK